MSSAHGTGSLGLSSYAFHWSVAARTPLDAAHFLLERARALQLSVVQLADDVDLDGVAAADLAALRDSAGTAGVSLQRGSRGLEPAALHREIDAATLGGNLLRVVPGGAGATHLDRDQLTSALVSHLPVLDATGVTLAIENHATIADADLAAAITRLDHPRVGVCLDTANSVGLLARPVDTVARLAPLARVVHLKDFAVVGPDCGYRITGAPLGAGDLPIDEVCALLASAPHAPPLLVELWVDGPGPARSQANVEAQEEDWTRRSVERARALFGHAP